MATKPTDVFNRCLDKVKAVGIQENRCETMQTKHHQDQATEGLHGSRDNFEAFDHAKVGKREISLTKTRNLGRRAGVKKK